MAPQQVDSGDGDVKKGSCLCRETSKGSQRGQERTWAKAGAGPEQGQPRPSPAPRARPRGEPEAGRRRPCEGDERQSSAGQVDRRPSLSRGASRERSATRPGAMATRRRWPGVVPGPALGWLLLLLSALAPGRASPRLLDFPAPVCAQEVRGAGRSEDAGAVGGGGEDGREDGGGWGRGVRGAGVGRTGGSAKGCLRCGEPSAVRRGGRPRLRRAGEPGEAGSPSWRLGGGPGHGRSVEARWRGLREWSRAR